MSERQRISTMAWKSYEPLIKEIATGRATAKTYAHLDKLILEDIEDHHAATAAKVIPVLLWKILSSTMGYQQDHHHNLLYDAIHSHGIARHILEMRFIEKDIPLLTDPRTCVDEAFRVRKRVQGWLENHHDGELYYAVYDDLLISFVAAAKTKAAAFKRQRELFQEAIRDELMAAAWHPRRVETWLKAGLEIEDL